MSEAIELEGPDPNLDTDLSKRTSITQSEAGNHVPHDLKRKTACGALASTFGLGATLVLRTGSMVALARLLTPADFGLVGMVTACIGFLVLIQDAGLSMATIQRVSITRAQTSTLFWINLAFGIMLAALSAAIAPLVAAVYHEPRLFWVTVIFGSCFVFCGAAAQHRAILQREMHFMRLAVIDIVAQCVAITVGIAMALAGEGYWALVGMTVSAFAVILLGVWAAGGWMPGPPQRRVGVRSMLKYGGTVTLNGLVFYTACNADKVLLGRFYGAETLGIYGRAYQLINLPTVNLNMAIGSVAIPALSRLQNDPDRLRSYFLKGYSLFLSVVLPITVAYALFAEDIVLVFLGPKWGAAVPVFRLLAPTILAFALINPLGWLMLATDRATRFLKIALMIAPIVILGYVAGLSYGSRGVAAGSSITTVLLVVPVIFWATRGTPITAVDIFIGVMRPLLSILIGASTTLVVWNFIDSIEPVLFRLIVANAVLFGVYTSVLWLVMGQKAVYLGLLREIGIWPLPRRRRKEKSVEHGDV